MYGPSRRHEARIGEAAIPGYFSTQSSDDTAEINIHSTRTLAT